MPPRPVPARDAAVFILVDRSASPWRALMGRQASGHPYMPGCDVFPGGKTERADYAIKTDAPPSARTLALTQKRRRGSDGPIRRARAVAIAMSAVRELYEETGYAYGTPVETEGGGGGKVAGNDEGEGDGKNGGWEGYFRLGVNPELSRLRLVARAVTPSSRLRRYDARYFIGDCADGLRFQPKQAERHGELEKVRWVAVDAIRDMAIPFILGVVCADIEAFLKGDFSQPDAIPCYHTRGDRFLRLSLRV